MEPGNSFELFFNEIGLGNYWKMSGIPEKLKEGLYRKSIFCRYFA